MPTEDKIIKIVDGQDPDIQATIADKGDVNALSVQIVDGSGNQITTFGGSGGTAMTDDAAFTPGTTSVTPAAGVYRSSRDSVNDNDAGALAMTATRALMTTIETPDGDSAMDDVNDAVNVNIVAGSSSGVQYTEGDTDASITGTAMMMEGAANALVAAPGTATDGLLVNLGSNNDVSVTSSALPTGAATAANQTTIIGHVDGIEGLLTTIDSDSSTIAGAVDGTEMQVDVVAALPAGTNNIGDVDIASIAAGDNNIGNVDIASIAAGDNNIGNVDLASSIPAGTNNIGDVDVLTQPARDRLTDNVGVALQTDALLNDTTALTPKFAAIDAATSGDNTLVAAVASKKVRVLSLFLVSAGTVNARFEDGAGGSALTGQMNLVANTGFVLPFNPIGWFETTANTLLNLELSGAVSVDGSLVYVEV